MQGNVGIGTAQLPQARLEITGATADATSASLHLQNASANSLLFVRNDGQIGVNTQTPGAMLYVAGTASQPNPISFGVGDEKGNCFFSIKNNGSVKIGTSSVPGSLGVFGKTAIGSGYAGSSSIPDNGLLVQGKMGIATDKPQSDLSVAGKVAIGKGYVESQQTPEDGLVVQGKVGIGTTNPANLLSVAGRVAIGTTYAVSQQAPDNGLLVQGNVGIGTTTLDDQAALTVAGNVTLGRTSGSIVKVLGQAMIGTPVAPVPTDTSLWVGGKVDASIVNTGALQIDVTKQAQQNIVELGSGDAVRVLQTLNPIRYTSGADLISRFGLASEPGFPSELTVSNQQAFDLIGIIAILLKMVKDQQGQLQIQGETLATQQAINQDRQSQIQTLTHQLQAQQVALQNQQLAFNALNQQVEEQQQEIAKLLNQPANNPPLNNPPDNPPNDPGNPGRRRILGIF